VAFPINREARAWLEDHVMRAYQAALRDNKPDARPDYPSGPSMYGIA
jgi:hypothetical protein